MTVNVELLHKVMEKIESDPDHWYQSFWATKTDCGTAFCFAGWAAVLSGGKPIWKGKRIQSDLVQVPGRGAMAIEEFAKEVLGITRGDADWLFESTLELEQLRQAVSVITLDEGAKE